VRKGLIFITLIIHCVSISILFPDHADAWWSWTRSTNIESTHDRIGKKAFELVGPKLSNNFLKYQANYVDQNNPGYLWYTYTPDNDTAAHGGNPARNGGDIDLYYKNFLSAYNMGDVSEAREWLGYCIHLIEDMNVPAHAFNIPHYNVESITGKSLPYNFDNLEQAADYYDFEFTIDKDAIREDDPTVNPISYYDKTKGATINEVDNWGFSDYWHNGNGDQWCGEYGVPGCKDGTRGYYSNTIFKSNDDKFPVFQWIPYISPEWYFVQNQLNNSVKFVGMFLLAVDRTLPAEPTDDDQYEDNDSLYNAADIMPRFYNATLKCNDEDWYKMWVQPGQSIQVIINFPNAIGDLDLELYDSSGNLLSSSAGNTDKEKITYTSYISSYYYIKVYGYNNAKNSYSMNIDLYSSNLPDLTVHANNEKSYAITEGYPFWVEGFIYNSGLSWAGQSHVKLWLSTNDYDYITYGDYYIGEKTVSALDPLIGKWIRWDFTMPNISTGVYGVWAKWEVDSWNEVYEGNENNVYYVMNGPLFTAYDAVVLTGLTVNGPFAVNENSSATYTVKAWWSNGSTSIINPSSWYVYSSYATINTDGSLSTLSVDVNQYATVSVTFSYGGVTKTAYKDIMILDVSATLSALNIYGPASVDENSSGDYIAIASWSDGTTSVISPVWSENSSYTTINSSGKLTTSAVTSNQTATITANYTFAGVTKTAKKTVKVKNITNVLTALSINGLSAVNSGGAATYSATASWNNGTTSTVVPTWSVNSSFATIGSSGLMSAVDVGSNQTVTITASYISGGVTETANKTVTIFAGTVLAVISSNPDGGVSIAVSPNDNSGQGNGLSQFIRNYNIDTNVALTAPYSVNGNNFAKWSGCDSIFETTCYVTMNGTRTVKVNYNYPPDLVITSVGFTPSKVIRGGNITVADITKNQGQGPSGESTTSYYLSVNKKKDNKDILLADSSSVQALNETESSPGTTPVIIPSNIKPGAYYVIACADDMQQVTETNENNNCRASKKKIKVKK